MAWLIMVEVIEDGSRGEAHQATSVNPLIMHIG